MSALLRRLRADLVAAYATRFALAAVSLVLAPLPRRHKVTMLTRQSNTTPADFRMLRDAILRADPSIEVVMIARMVPAGILPKFGYAAHLLSEMHHAATSRMLVIDGYSAIASSMIRSKGLTVVQLWHALGALKKFGLSILGQPGGRDPRLAKAMRMHQGYDVVIASAERCRAPFAEAFGVDESQVVVAPLPRVDRLRDPQARADARERFFALYPDLTGTKIALFAPTFRNDGAQRGVSSVTLTRELGRIGYAMITKLHPIVAPPKHPELRTAPGMSTQDLLLVADIFITDYSSTVFEAAVAGVPSYLIAPDLQDYSQRRDFYVKYPDDLGLPMATDVPGLMKLVRAGACDVTTMARMRAEFIAELPERGDASSADNLTTVLSARAWGRPAAAR